MCCSCIRKSWHSVSNNHITTGRWEIYDAAFLRKNGRTNCGRPFLFFQIVGNKYSCRWDCSAAKQLKDACRCAAGTVLEDHIRLLIKSLNLSTSERLHFNRATLQSGTSPYEWTGSEISLYTGGYFARTEGGDGTRTNPAWLQQLLHCVVPAGMHQQVVQDFSAVSLLT